MARVGEDPPAVVTAADAPIPAERLTVVPANEASWDDLAAIFSSCRTVRYSRGASVVNRKAATDRSAFR